LDDFFGEIAMEIKKFWAGIHSEPLAELKRRYGLKSVDLKHPFPERPWRMLGLLRFDGEVYCTERLVRALFLKTTVVGTSARSLLLCPRAEYNFPVFSNETIIMGRQVLFLVDVQQVFPSPARSLGSLIDDLQSIRSGYSGLLHSPVEVSGEIARGFSPAAVYVKLDPNSDTGAADLLLEYLTRYLEALDAVTSQTEGLSAGAQQAFDDYADLVVNHDPAMRFLKRMFGGEGARERAYDMFFGK
jgi:hypothetical protein